MPFEPYVEGIQALWRGALVRQNLESQYYYPPGRERCHNLVYRCRQDYIDNYYGISIEVGDCLYLNRKHRVHRVQNTTLCHCDWCWDDIDFEKWKYECGENCDFDICEHCYRHAHDDLWSIIH